MTKVEFKVDYEAGESLELETESDLEDDSEDMDDSSEGIEFEEIEPHRFTPFKMLQKLSKPKRPEYSFSSFKKYNITVHVCTVVVNNVTGVGKYYNKKVAKYFAAIEALRQLGVDVDYNLDVEPDIQPQPPKSENEDSALQTVGFISNGKETTIQMLGFDDTPSPELMNAFRKGIFQLESLDDNKQMSVYNSDNMANKLLFLWYDFKLGAPRYKCPKRTHGSNLLENPIGYLNERCAQFFVPMPEYTYMKIRGTRPHYISTVSIAGLSFNGKGPTKKDAKWRAARNVVKYAAYKFEGFVDEDSDSDCTCCDE